MLVKYFYSADLTNEFEPTDELLTSTFLYIFPLGKCFSRSTRNFNNEQIDHIMKQFHQILR